MYEPCGHHAMYGCVVDAPIVAGEHQFTASNIAGAFYAIVNGPKLGVKVYTEEIPDSSNTRRNQNQQNSGY